MAVLNQSAALLSDVVKEEWSQNYSREGVTLLTGRVYAIGDVLGQITTGGKFTISPATGADGSQTAVAVCLTNIDATGGDQKGIVLRRGPAIIGDQSLNYDSTVDDTTKKAAKRAQLLAVGIVSRVQV